MTKYNSFLIFDYYLMLKMSQTHSLDICCKEQGHKSENNNEGILAQESSADATQDRTKSFADQLKSHAK